jgi:hypothetical protein
VTKLRKQKNQEETDMKTTTKHDAQHLLIVAMQSEFCSIAEGVYNVDADVLEAMGQQFERVERLFGYEPGTHGKGL